MDGFGVRGNEDFGWCVVLLERYLGIVRSRGRYGAWRYLLTNLVSVTVPPEQGLTLLTQLVKLLHPLCRRLYRQLLG